MTNYLSALPETVPTGLVIVHNRGIPRLRAAGHARVEVLATTAIGPARSV
jgi:hypothetical protein